MYQTIRSLHNGPVERNIHYVYRTLARTAHLLSKRALNRLHKSLAYPAYPEVINYWRGISSIRIRNEYVANCVGYIFSFYCSHYSIIAGISILKNVLKVIFLVEQRQLNALAII